MELVARTQCACSIRLCSSHSPYSSICVPASCFIDIIRARDTRNGIGSPATTTPIYILAFVVRLPRLGDTFHCAEWETRKCFVHVFTVAVIYYSKCFQRLLFCLAAPIPSLSINLKHFLLLLPLLPLLWRRMISFFIRCAAMLCR